MTTKILALILILLILGASWVPDSRMSSLPWLPHRLAQAADFHPYLRTAIPFIPLAILMGAWLARRAVRHPDRLTFLLCIGCVVLAEAGQIFLPARSCDWRDVLCGALGALIGLVITKIYRTCLKKPPPFHPSPPISSDQ